MELHEHSPDRKGEAANSMLRWEHLSREFRTGSCHGRYSIFEDREPAMVIVMIAVEDTLWIGRFFGSMDDWRDALAILQTARRSR
jgi:hypothetical protein